MLFGDKMTTQVENINNYIIMTVGYHLLGFNKIIKIFKKYHKLSNVDFFLCIIIFEFIDSLILAIDILAL